MTDRATHITLDVFADYFAELLDDEQEERVELHIADCERCAASARWVHSLPRPNLEDWTAEAHGEATLRAYLAESLSRTEVPEESWSERLLHWSERLAGEARGALHLVKEASGTVSRGLDVLLPPSGWDWAARPVRASVPVAFKGDDSQTRVGSDAEAAPTVRVIQKGIGIEVRVENVEEGAEPRLVALIPTREGGEVKVCELESVSDEPRVLRARFVKEDEDFVIALEPDRRE